MEYLHEEDLSRALEQRINIDGKLIECSRVFLKQETKEKGQVSGTSQEKPTQDASTICAKTQKASNKPQSSRAKLYSNGKISVTEIATQGSLGSSGGEWEKEQTETEVSPGSSSSASRKNASKASSDWPAAPYLNDTPDMDYQPADLHETNVHAWKYDNSYRLNPQDYEYRGPYEHESEELPYMSISSNGYGEGSYPARFPSVVNPRVWNSAGWPSPYRTNQCEYTAAHFSPSLSFGQHAGSMKQKSYYRMF